MAHPEDTRYYIVSLLHAVTGEDIRSYAVDHPGNPFGEQDKISQDGIVIGMDARLKLTWAELVAIEPRLAGHVFTALTIPSYLTLGCEDCTYSEFVTLTSSEGPMGTAYYPPGIAA